MRNKKIVLKTILLLFLLAPYNFASFRSFFSQTTDTESPLLSIQAQPQKGIIETEAIAYPSPAINGETEIGLLFHKVTMQLSCSTR